MLDMLAESSAEDDGHILTLAMCPWNRLICIGLYSSDVRGAYHLGFDQRNTRTSRSGQLLAWVGVLGVGGVGGLLGYLHDVR